MSAQKVTRLVPLRQDPPRGTNLRIAWKHCKIALFKANHSQTMFTKVNNIIECLLGLPGESSRWYGMVWDGFTHWASSASMSSFLSSSERTSIPQIQISGAVLRFVWLGRLCTAQCSQPDFKNRRGGDPHHFGHDSQSPR